MNTRRPDNHGHPADPRTAIPAPVRLAGWISSAQGLIGLVTALALIVRAIGGHREETVVISGYATAGWFVILGGGLMAAGIGLLTGRRWGRGLVLIAELLILVAVGSSVFGATGSAIFGEVGLVLYAGAIALAVSCAVALASLLRREAVEWYAA
ncbi:hypothetical protein K3888_10775 [Dietzia aurantiaca]|mgnify:CR=1 FL=1|uniref:Integral membrane protein n=1 Tax=Dietzia aurantiaca TaxID=983873 RepID=A0ABV9PPA7_9ACTN|nr:hypothetical protein [Dietzia aurantiaca]MCD2263184.1 hypothetical protein [Dietzia aurantiaca]